MPIGASPCGSGTPRLAVLRGTTLRTLAAHISDSVVPADQLRPDLPADLQTVLVRCLEKDPNRRFPAADSPDQALAQTAWWPPQRRRLHVKKCAFPPKCAELLGGLRSVSAVYAEQAPGPD
jgi:serine/threonine protein kinase